MNLNGDIKVKTPTNTARYGIGNIITDQSIQLKEIASSSNPPSTYDNIYVDSTSKRLRIKDNTGLVRDVGLNYKEITINTAINVISFTQVGSLFYLPGSANGGMHNNVPTAIKVLSRSGATGTHIVRIVDTLSGLTIATTPNITNNSVVGITTVTSISNYPTTDSIFRVDAARTSSAGLIVSIVFIY